MIDPKKLLPPQVLLILYLAAFIIQFTFTPGRVMHDLYGGWILAFSGLAFMRWARYQFTKNGTPVKHSETPCKFVLEGPYRFSRNPMYLGGLTMLLGIGMVAGTWPFLSVPLVMWLILEFIYIPWEEKTMVGLFGDDYAQYLKKTRRWF